MTDKLTAQQLKLWLNGAGFMAEIDLTSDRVYVTGVRERVAPVHGVGSKAWRDADKDEIESGGP